MNPYKIIAKKYWEWRLKKELIVQTNPKDEFRYLFRNVKGVSNAWVLINILFDIKIHPDALYFWIHKNKAILIAYKKDKVILINNYSLGNSISMDEWKLLKDMGCK